MTAMISPNRFAVRRAVRIATNASTDRWRSRKTSTEQALDPEARAGDLGHEPHRVDQLHDLALFARGLSEEELTVALLYHFDGVTQDGIAASLDISRKTVGKILARFEAHVKKRAARLGFSEKGARLPHRKLTDLDLGLAVDRVAG